MERLQSRMLTGLGAASALWLSFGCSDSTRPSPRDCTDDLDCESSHSTGEDDTANEDDEPTARDAATKRDSGGGSPSLDAGRGTSGIRLDAETGTARADAGAAYEPDAKASVDQLDASSEQGSEQTLPPVSDYEQPGPFEPAVLTAQGPGGAYTIFRPKTLGERDFKHSPVIFGCGILTTPDWYTKFLSTVASHGFVVIASNSSNVTDADMMQGLEWILAQNQQSGDYQGKLDVNRAVSMGYSIGGTSAVNVGAHASVVTTISIHGHNTMAALHGPLLQTTGTNDDIGMPLQQMTYDASEVQTFLATLTNASHFEILGGEELQEITDVVGPASDGDGGRELGPIIAWLRYWIYGDEGAKPFFYGGDCLLCRAPWENPQRKNWPED